MKISLLSACFLFSTSFSFAQSGLQCSHMKCQHHSNDRSASLPLEYIALTEEYDVHFYKLDVALERTSTDIAGSVEIHVHVKAPILDTFLCELFEDIPISDIQLNGTLSVPFTRVGSAVIVPVSFVSGDSFFMKIDYAGTPPTALTNPLGGAGMSNEFSPSWGNQVTWSLSQPFSAYEWWPCKQSLTDKADSVYVFITTDASNKAGSNGILTDVADVGGGKMRYEWKSNYPIDYYLVSVAVAQYVDYTIYANPVGSPQPIMIQNYIYNNPSTLPYFQDEIDNTADFIEHFSNLYGLYPFVYEKYGHCMAPIGGGMEHQTMTTQGYFDDGLTAHELGHQWFGDHVTCASWADIWLNEGFASYTEELMYETFYPGDELASMQDRHDDIMSLPHGSVWVEDSLDAGAVFSGRLTYNKGAAIIHTMRFIINDDALFFDVLQAYLTTFADSTAYGSDFKATLETVTGNDYTAFFNEWYYGQGYPTYSIEWNQENSSVWIQLDQSVSMPGVTPFFTNDLEIGLVDDLGATTVVRLGDITGPTSLHYLGFTGVITDIVIDPNNWIINDEGGIIENTSLVSIAENQAGVMVYPNPANATIWLDIPAAATYQVMNAMGQVVASGTAVSGKNEITISQLSAGNYSIRTPFGTTGFVKY
jgi:aminopeptidase N